MKESKSISDYFTMSFGDYKLNEEIVLGLEVLWHFKTND